VPEIAASEQARILVPSFNEAGTDQCRKWETYAKRDVEIIASMRPALISAGNDALEHAEILEVYASMRPALISAGNRTR